MPFCLLQPPLANTHRLACAIGYTSSFRHPFSLCNFACYDNTGCDCDSSAADSHT